MEEPSPTAADQEALNQLLQPFLKAGGFSLVSSDPSSPKGSKEFKRARGKLGKKGNDL